MTETNAPTTDPQHRLDAFIQMRETFPDLDPDQLMEIVDWALGNVKQLDVDALEQAARALAKAEGSEWNGHHTVPSTYRGLAAHTIGAYLAAIL